MLRIAVLTLVIMLAALPNRPSVAVAEPPSLVLMLATDVPAYPAGAPVTFTVAVDNRGDAPVTLVFPSAQLFDIAVLAEQREVWRWAADRDFAQAETERTFPTGLTLLGRVTWDWRDSSGVTLRPGVYQVQGTLATVPRQPGNLLLVELLGP
jgi:uncharacterized protein (DUF58 family)